MTGKKTILHRIRAEKRSACKRPGRAVRHSFPIPLRNWSFPELNLS